MKDRIENIGFLKGVALLFAIGFLLGVGLFLGFKENLAEYRIQSITEKCDTNRV